MDGAVMFIPVSIDDACIVLNVDVGDYVCLVTFHLVLKRNHFDLFNQVF